MNGEYISLEDAKKIRRYNILLKRIKILKKENIRLKSIIKEVREYINWRLEEHQDMYKYQMEELLEILDKENK